MQELDAILAKPGAREAWDALPDAEKQVVLRTLYPERDPRGDGPAPGRKPFDLLSDEGPPIMLGGGQSGMNPLVNNKNAAMYQRFAGLHPLVPSHPLAQGAVGALGEMTAQELEGGPKDPTAVAAAGATPVALSALARLVRGGGRMATRMVPSLFDRAHGKAQESFTGMAERIAPPGQADDLMRAASEAAEGGGYIPTISTSRLLEQMGGQLDRTPSLSKEGDALRTLVGKAGALKGDLPGTIPAVPLATADAYLKEANRAIPSAPREARALAGSLVRDIEDAATGGNTEASLLRKAAEAYKRQMGVEELQRLRTGGATREGAIGQTEALDIAKLANLVRKHPDLPRLLGPAGMQEVQAFLRAHRGLPPTHGATWATGALGALAGTAGGVAGGIPGGLIGLLGPEFARNVYAAKGNAPGLNRALSAAGQAGRIAVPGLLEYLRNESR